MNPDLVRFAAAMIASQDLDPLYPVLRSIHAEYGLGVEDRIWHTFLYLAYYNLPTGHAVWLDTDNLMMGGTPWHMTAATGTERRNLRHPDEKGKHFTSYLELTADGQEAWWTAGFGDDPVDNWRLLQERTQLVHGNGRWAAYKMGDLARYVLDWPVQAADTGMRHSSGPRQGLCIVYDYDDDGRQDPDTVALWEGRARGLQMDLSEEGVWMPIDQIETLLCDWKSLTKGGYYVGHDIDLLLEATVAGANRLPEHVASTTYRDIIDARADALPNAYLGELWGWTGVDRDLKRRYRDHGELWTRPDWEERPKEATP